VSQGIGAYFKRLQCKVFAFDFLLDIVGCQKGGDHLLFLLSIVVPLSSKAERKNQFPKIKKSHLK